MLSRLRSIAAAMLLFIPSLRAQSAEADSTLDSPGQDTVTAPVRDMQTLAPVEVRSIRAGNEAPFSKTEISGKELQKDNLGQDLPFLLQYTPSVVVTSDAGAGVGYTGMRIRGTDGTRINTTLNGVPVNDAESSGTYFVDLPDLATSTSSIQIQRGVGSSTNGAGAFGGTLSISNLDVFDKAGAEAALSYGSFNTQKYSVNAGTGMLPGQVAFNVRLSRISSDGFVDRATSRLSALQLQGLWKVSKKTSVKAMLLLGEEHTYQAWNGVPEEKLRGSDSALIAHYTNNVGVLYFSPRDSQNLFGSNPRTYNYFTYNNQTDNYRQNYYQLFIDHEFSPKLSAQLGLFLTRGIGYYEEYQPQQSFASYGLQPFILPGLDTLSRTDLIRRLWLDNYYYGAVYSLLWNPAEHTNINIGGGWSQYIGSHYGDVIWAQYGMPDNYRWYTMDAQKNDFNIYIKGTQKFGRHLFGYGDLQFRTIGYFMNGFQDNPNLKPAVTYNFFNPKAGLTWMLPSQGRQRQKLYASFAVAHKEPNRDDFEAADSSLPRPERLYDLEGGYELMHARYGISVNAFYMDYKDQLVLTGKVNDVGAYTRTNVPNSYRTGLEFQASWTMQDWLKLSANATLSRNIVDSFTEFVDNYDDGTQRAIAHHNTDIAFSPSAVAGGGILITPFANSEHGRGFGIELLGKYVGKQYLDNTSDASRSLKAYGLCDVRLRYQLVTSHFRELNLSLMLNNVFNRQYESNGYTYSYISGNALTTQNFYFPQAGTNWLLGLGMKL